jgi:hypothetical protein
VRERFGRPRDGALAVEERAVDVDQEPARRRGRNEVESAHRRGGQAAERSASTGAMRAAFKAG